MHVNQNKKSKQGQHHPLNMVWNLRRSSRETTQSNQGLRGENVMNVRGCSKKDSDQCSQQSSEASPKKNCDLSTTRDQSTKSEGSRSSRSGNSRLSESSSRRGSASERKSCTSGSSASSGISSRSKNSATRTSQRSESSANQQPEKGVRFNVIQIREYERIVADNPSCSSGPPIGIGWSYGDTRSVNINHYEDSRPFRKAQVKMVLTREERETLLLSWGISFHDIIESVRINVKVKNQRRQTVTNLGKVERIEEAFESATRKLKRALLLRRPTGVKVKQLQEQAALAQNALASLKIAEQRALNDIRSDLGRVEVEPEEDNLENLEVQVSVSDFCRSSPSEAMIHRAASTMSEEEGSTLSGFTFGNSTTASVLEMEQFYRDLELEMFGDMELPSMVGQTLEVPGLEIPEEDRVYHDAPSATGYPVDDGSLPPPNTNDINAGMQVHYELPPGSHITPLDSTEPLLLQQDRTMLNQPVEDDAYFPGIHSQPSYPVGSAPVPPYHHYPIHSPHYMAGDNPAGNPHFVNARLSDDPLDSADLNRYYAYQSILALEQEYSRAARRPPSTQGSQHSSDSSHRNSSSRQNSASDGPRIQYIPPSSHLSPTHWMEGEDGPAVRRTHETVTITEEGFEREDRSFSGGGNRHYVAPDFDRFRQPQQFPPSFY